MFADNPRLSRRAWLARAANGFGAVALSALWAERGSHSSAASDSGIARTGGVGVHHPPRVRNVIFLYMDGGPSQVDTFDYKPELERLHGRDPREIFKVEPTQFANVGKVLASPWKFRRRGESGLWVSDLFPQLARKADDLCVIRSMVSRFSEHTSANYFLHTGFGIQGRPSAGAWTSYGLGSENRDLPGFLVLNGGLIPVGGLDNFAAGFLPADHQGSILRPGDEPVANIRRREPTPEAQRRKLDLARKLDLLAVADRPDPGIEAAIAQAETAYRMQTSVPDLTDVSGESPATRALYGVDDPFEPKAVYARQCLIARRLVERGARFVELTCPQVNGHDRWDQHSNLKRGHEDNARVVDQPIAALLTDLKSRGLWDHTLVVFAGEFGRTPFAQGADGRDHNPFGFSVWLAGGGVRGGHAHGLTDEFGYRAIADRVEIHDLHATMLHLLGIDHTRLTFRFGGRDMRLTDVHGEVVEGVLA